jgi:alanine-glyoxylate transaminase/serine-glyoxylate transaminase/serine-pyruvate transaminase
MTVRHGREFLAIPGPSTVPDAVLQAMQQPAQNIYHGPLLDVTASLLADLKWIFQTEYHSYIYAANGHGAWEAALTNVLSRGDTILILNAGRFASGWGNMAKMLGVTLETIDNDGQRGVDADEVEDYLRADTKGRIKAILVVQVDTASSVVNDIPAIRKAIDAAGHDALFMVDTIASLGTMPFKQDEWGVDVAVSASQKGLMMSPGLSFVGVNAKARAAHETANLRTAYWDWTAREGSVHYEKYGGTPPVHLMYGLRKSFDLLKEEGLENIFNRHRILAGAVRAAIAEWSKSNLIGFNVTDEADRANSVTTILTGETDPGDLLDYCEQRCGVVLGMGIGHYSGRSFRIAHMGHLNAPMILGTLGVTEIGMRAVGLPHGAGGLQAATDWIVSQVPA